MSVEQTLSIIKPDAVAKNVTGQINARFEAAGLQIVAQKMLRLSDDVAGGFYAEHKERPFYPDLVSFMTSGPVVVQVLEGEGAILKNRELMGATNPAEADAGTIRADFANSIDQTRFMVPTRQRLLRARLLTFLLPATSVVGNRGLRCRKR